MSEVSHAAHQMVALDGRSAAGGCCVREGTGVEAAAGATGAAERASPL